MVHATAPRGKPQSPKMTTTTTIDLRLNYPVLPGQAETLRAALADLATDADRVAEILALPPYEGRPADRARAAAWLSGPSGEMAADDAAPIGPDAVLLGAGGHHAVFAALLAVGVHGGVIVTDPLTYSGLIAQAGLLGARLVACPGDADGMDPAALRDVCEREGDNVRLVYLMPTVHNPLGTVMSLARRRELVAVARERDLLLLDDDAYGFLEANPPPSLARLAPERAFQVVSFSKPFGPGLKLSFLVAPPAWRTRAAGAIRQTVSGAVTLWAGLVTGWLADGTLTRVVEAKRAEAIRRQAVAREILAGLDYSAHPTGFHGWLRLPAGTDADALHARLLADGVDTVPASAFAVERATALAGLRVALGQEPDAGRREAGLRRVATAVRDASG